MTPQVTLPFLKMTPPPPKKKTKNKNNQDFKNDPPAKWPINVILTDTIRMSLNTPTKK